MQPWMVRNSERLERDGSSVAEFQWIETRFSFDDEYATRRFRLLKNKTQAIVLKARFEICQSGVDEKFLDCLALLGRAGAGCGR